MDLQRADIIALRTRTQGLEAEIHRDHREVKRLARLVDEVVSRESRAHDAMNDCNEWLRDFYHRLRQHDQRLQTLEGHSHLRSAPVEPPVADLSLTAPAAAESRPNNLVPLFESLARQFGVPPDHPASPPDRA